jgi:hypothetical protein
MLVRVLIADLLPVRAAARKVMTVCRVANGRPDAVPGMVGATRTLGHLITDP